ncbi:MAG: hypothetical protein KatS3mg023_2072 [Armatimonadota bacterium]|nr:MAG: hypothetical protein KatS3mg023_2072 [Armatimonadota bacterium]
MNVLAGLFRFVVLAALVLFVLYVAWTIRQDVE